MSQFWEGVFTGIATSGFVAGIVYLIQKRDSDKSTTKLTTQIEISTEVSREALRTTIEARDITTEMHKAVLSGQIKAASDADRETLRPEHVAQAEAYLEMMKATPAPDIKPLHTLLMGEEVVYAGLVRDASVVVSGNVSASSPLTPLKAEAVPQQLQEWLTSLSSLLVQQPSSGDQNTLRQIAKLHVDLMRIHPFFDGNGLVGRALLAALGKRLLGRVYLVPRADPKYFTALRNALDGDIEPLVEYLERNSEGITNKVIPCKATI
jgi:Fic family protein